MVKKKLIQCHFQKTREINVFYSFENKSKQVVYLIELENNGNIVLDKSKESRKSKPMEYKRTSE